MIPQSGQMGQSEFSVVLWGKELSRVPCCAGEPNSKFESRNPKQARRLKAPNSKRTKAGVSVSVIEIDNDYAVLPGFSGHTRGADWLMGRA